MTLGTKPDTVGRRNNGLFFVRTRKNRRFAQKARLALLIAVVGLIASPSYAQPTPIGDAGVVKPSAAEAQAEARIEMREGLAAFDAKDYEAALKRFRRAMELVPEANLPHRHAAKALEALDRWEEALTEHQEYLRVKPDVSDAAAVRERIDEIKRTHLSGFVELHCEPEPNEVFVDGTSIVPIESAQKLRLAKGTHRILVRSPGSVPREIEVTISNAGQTITPECMLERAPAAAPIGSPSAGGQLGSRPPPKEAPTPWYGRWYTWAGAGALAAGGLILGILVAGASRNPPPASEGGNHVFP